MARQSDPSETAVPVLVTRPLAQGEAFARALTDRFGTRVRPVVAPLMATEFLSPPVPDGHWDAAIFTSATGVEGARRLGADLPRRAYCVGRATADAATAAGFDARSADGDATDLATNLLAGPGRGRFLYLRGVHTAGDLANTLIARGYQVLSLKVYLQKFTPLKGESRSLFRQCGPVILPLFSPRSARLLGKALPADTRAALRIAVMSEAVARAAADLPQAALIVAARPDAPAMLDAVETLLATGPLP